MLKYDTVYRQLLSTGEKVPIWVAAFELSNTQGTESIRDEFLIDTGSTYTLLPMELAFDIGLNPDRLRNDRQRSVRVAAANSSPMTAHLHEVLIRLDDDCGGWAQWKAWVGFCDDLKRPHAGKSGFLNYLAFADQGPHFTLEPSGRLQPDQYACGQRTLVAT